MPAQSFKMKLLVNTTMCTYKCNKDSCYYQEKMHVTKHKCISFLVWLRQLSLHNKLHKDNKCPYKNTNHRYFVPKRYCLSIYKQYAYKKEHAIKILLLNAVQQSVYITMVLLYLMTYCQLVGWSLHHMMVRKVNPNKSRYIHTSFM